MLFQFILISCLLHEPRALRESIRFQGHTQAINQIVWSEDGEQFASADDAILRIWDCLCAESLHAIKVDSPVTAMRFNRQRSILAVGKWNGTIDLFDLKSGEIKRSLKVHRENITSIAFDAAGKRLASGSGDDTLIVWDTTTGKSIIEIEQGNDYDVTCVEFSPDGKWVASGDGENHVKLWNAEDGREVATFVGHTETISAVQFSPDGKQLLSASWDRTVRIWDVKTEKLVRKLTAHSDAIVTARYLSSGKEIFSVSEDGTIRFWNAFNGKQRHRLERLKNQTVLAIRPDGLAWLVADGRELLLRPLESSK